MQITTLKIKKNTKAELDAFKTQNESYDETINRIMQQIRKKNLKKQLIEAYKNTSKEELILLEEWETASKEVQNGN